MRSQFVYEGQGKIKDFYGNYSDYYQWRMKEQKAAQRAVKPAKESNPVSKEKKASSKPGYKQLKDFETLEKEIHQLESEKDLVISRMNSGLETPESISGLSLKYNELSQLIDTETLLWMELGEVIEGGKG